MDRVQDAPIGEVIQACGLHRPSSPTPTSPLPLPPGSFTYLPVPAHRHRDVDMNQIKSNPQIKVYQNSVAEVSLPSSSWSRLLAQAASPPHNWTRFGSTLQLDPILSLSPLNETIDAYLHILLSALLFIPRKQAVLISSSTVVSCLLLSRDARN